MIATGVVIMPRVRPMAPIIAARTGIARRARHSFSGVGFEPPEPSARPTPARTANKAAERPPARSCTVPLTPSPLDKTCTDIIPSSATPRATSIAGSRPVTTSFDTGHSRSGAVGGRDVRGQAHLDHVRVIGSGVAAPGAIGKHPRGGEEGVAG